MPAVRTRSLLSPPGPVHGPAHWRDRLEDRLEGRLDGCGRLARYGRVAVALAALVASGLVGAERARAADYVGVEKCGACHPAEYQQWLGTGHASALARLSKVQQKDSTCRACHTMAPASEDAAYAGVQCEACHGPGRYYAPRYVMRDAELSRLLNLQPVTEDQCAPCHARDTPSVREFKFDEMVALVRHRAPREDDRPSKGTDRGSDRERAGKRGRSP